MCKEIDYIRSVIDDYDLSLTWIANQINKKFYGGSKVMTKQRISYIKESGKEISTTLYKQFRKVFDDHNYILSDFDEAPAISSVVKSLNMESAELVNTTIDALANQIIEENERADIKLQTALIRKRLDKIEQLLEGGR